MFQKIWEYRWLIATAIVVGAVLAVGFSGDGGGLSIEDLYRP